MSEILPSFPESVRLVKKSVFEEDPEAVIDQANETDQPVVVTSHGRFLFLVEPLEAQQLSASE